MKKNSLFSILFLSTLFAVAQSWAPVGTGVATSADALALYNNQLVAGGKTTTLTLWGGSNWSAFSGGSPTATALLADGSDLYAGGSFAGGNDNKVIRKYSGSGWSILGNGTAAYGNVTWNANSKWSRIFKYNNKIYGIYDGGIVKYDANAQNFIAPGDASTDLGAVINGIKYGGVANNVAYFSGMNNGRQRIITWNDNQWDTLNLSAYPNRSIASVAVLNNEVYFSGMFQKANNSTFSLLKWNGSSITEIFGFGPTVQTVVKMFAQNNHLYAEYTVQGFRRFGLWNGSGFSQMGGNVLSTSGTIDAAIEKGNVVYVSGTFSTFDGVSTNNISQFGGPVSVDDWQPEETLSVYPNPAQERLFIDASAHIRTLSIYNMAGQKCFSTTLLPNEKEIALDGLQSGMYLLSAWDGATHRTCTIVKY